ncbi:MAG: hypothetical protein ACE5F1_20135, partial [Planctomycetota bacterium]
FGAGRQSGDHTVFLIDLTHDLRYFSTHYYGGVSGFEIELPSADGSALERAELKAFSRVEILSLPRRLAGATIRLEEIHLHLRAPEPAIPDLELRFVLLGPGSGQAMPVEAGKPVLVPEPEAKKQRRDLRLSRQRRYYYYFEARSPAGTSFGAARSLVDWFTAAR